MSEAVLSTDFIVSPAWCNEDVLEARIADLVEMRKLIGGLAGVCIEDNAVEDLAAAGLFPAEGLFRKNLARCEVTAYSAKDVSKVVNSILSTVPAASSIFPELLVDWEDRLLEPKFDKIDPARQHQLDTLLEKLSVMNFFMLSRASLIHACNKNNFRKVELKGKVTTLYPDEGIALPVDVDSGTDILISCREYLATCDGMRLYLAAETPEDLKRAFFVGALHALRERGEDLASLAFDRFHVGRRFLASLKMNQCLEAQQFGGALYQAVVAVLADHKSSRFNRFMTTRGGAIPRTNATYTAYREHVTKAGVGLRLMFWRDGEGNIVLANVGPKQELVIHAPEV